MEARASSPVRVLEGLSLMQMFAAFGPLYVQCFAEYGT